MRDRYIWATTKSSGLPCLTDPKNKYVAISHVWSDGTGADRGTVHRCTFEFFQGIARDFFPDDGGEALWWDSVSIPKDSPARENAIRNMHSNFSEAEFTIVHDRYLAKYPWVDDGSPCIALALSPWFTRGWTALELLVSPKVKVIFQDPDNSSKHVLKNLDTEVLASHPGTCSRGHWIASSAIRKLRNKNITSLSDLEQILDTRSTSWPRDRLIIASLLCDIKPNFKDPNMLSNITQSIVLKYPSIDPSTIMHGGCIEREDGIFSWCPQALFLNAKPRISKGLRNLRVESDGTLSGTFRVRILDSKDLKHLQPFATHPSIHWKIQNALKRWQHCMLIWPEPIAFIKRDGMSDPGILVTVMDLNRPNLPNAAGVKSFIDCRMEGLVYGQAFPPEMNQQCLNEVESLSTYGTSRQVDIRLGKIFATGPSATAKGICERWAQDKMSLAKLIMPADETTEGEQKNLKTLNDFVQYLHHLEDSGYDHLSPFSQKVTWQFPSMALFDAS